MKIDHVALNTGNLDGLVEFYKRYFGGVEFSRYHNERTGLHSCTLTFDSGARLDIQTRPGHVVKAPDHSTGFGHIAMAAGGREEVDFITQRLESDGHPVLSQPRITGEGLYESTVLDPDGNWVEINGKL